MLRFLRNTAAVCLILSLFLHVAFWGGLHWSPTRPPRQPLQAIEVEIVEPVKRQKLEKLMQIVEQDKKLNDETPEDAKFLSQHSQRVVKETRAQNNGNFNNAVSGANKPKGQQETKKPKTQAQRMNGEMPTLKDLMPHFGSPKNSPDNAREDSQQKNGQPAATNDRLKDVNNGLQTLLNTREFVYYSYYQRIRAQIRQHWEPSIRAKVSKIFASGRTIASARDRITRVLITLDKNGALVNVQVLGESGIEDLDEAAIEAFRAAEPFPNPPKGIVEPDGTIKIRWDFILEADHGGNDFGPSVAQGVS